MRTKRFVSAALAAFMLLMTACLSEQITNVRVVVLGTGGGTTPSGCEIGLSITSDNTSRTLAVGETRQLNGLVTMDPPNCADLDDFQWTSSVPSVILVSQTGVITGIAPGSSEICFVYTPQQTIRACATFTVEGAPTSPTISVTPTQINLSTGFGCPATAPLTIVVNGVANAGINVTSSNSGVATVSGSSTTSGNVTTWTGTVTRAGATGDADINISVNGQPGLSRTVDVTVGNTNCNTPPGPTVTGISLSPENDALTVGATKTCSVTIFYSDGTSVSGTNALGRFTLTSSNPSQLSVNSATCQYTGVSPGTGLTITATANGTSLTDIMFVTVNAAPTRSVTFNPSSVCLSLVGGTSTTVQLTFNNVNASEVTFVPSNAGVTVSVSGNTLTITRVSADVGDIRAMHNGDVIGSLPWSVLAGACPGTGSSINYTPSGGTVTGTTTLTASCVQGSDLSEACEPFWTSNHPELITVRGTTAKVIDDTTFWVGMTAILERIAPTNGVIVEICVQWSITRTTPRRCYNWTAP